MLQTNNNKKIIPLEKQVNESLEVDTQTLTVLLSGLKQSLNYQNDIETPMLKHLRNNRRYLIKAFEDCYKDLIRAEVKIMNLSVAAESIKTRNDMINDIYHTVISEMGHQICH